MRRDPISCDAQEVPPQHDEVRPAGHNAQACVGNGRRAATLIPRGLDAAKRVPVALQDDVQYGEVEQRTHVDLCGRERHGMALCAELKPRRRLVEVNSQHKTSAHAGEYRTHKTRTRTTSTHAHTDKQTDTHTHRDTHRHTT